MGGRGPWEDAVHRVIFAVIFAVIFTHCDEHSSLVLVQNKH